MECPKSDDPRWLLSYQYEVAAKAAMNIGNFIILLDNLAGLSGRWKPIYEEAKKLNDMFKEEYNKLICQLMRES